MSQKPPPIPVIKQPMLTGLSLEDRNLMLAMMAALGSAATTLMKAGHVLDAYVQNEGNHLDPDNVALTIDPEVNAIIDLVKTCKDRLKPGRALLVN